MRQRVLLRPIVKWQFLISFCFIFILATDISYAAGILMRVQQIKAQRRQQEAQGMQQEDQGQQGSGSTPATQAPTYQQTVDQRNQAIAQAIRDAHNKSVSTASTSNVEMAQGQQQVLNPTVLPPSPASAPSNASGVQDVVDLSEVWKKLDKKSTVWPLLMDDQARLLTVSEYIGRFQKEGVRITAPPMHYAQAIDQIAQANPQMLQRPFGDLIQMLAIIDYDFDNGMDKDALARKVLGEAGYEANKKRFSQQ